MIDGAMPGLQKVKVRLIERDSGQAVDGGKLMVDDATDTRDLPCTLFLLPGNHTLTASHQARKIYPPNPRSVDVVIPTDPGTLPQEVIFEAEPPGSVIA
jgi:hypothetical protein